VGVDRFRLHTMLLDIHDITHLELHSRSRKKVLDILNPDLSGRLTILSSSSSVHWICYGNYQKSLI